MRKSAAVWDAMKQIFGTSFITIYGETPSRLWVEAIGGLTDAECRHGIDEVARQRREFPCNLTEFVDLCKPKSPGVRYLGVPETAEQKKLGHERKRASPEVAKKHLDHMRTLFK